MPQHDARLVEYGRPYKPRVSRETRRLLLTATLSLAVLWALAQVRFADRPAPVNPVQPLLTQINPPATLDDLSAEVATAETRAADILVALHAPAVRLRDDLAIVSTVVTSDRPTAAPTELVAYEASQGIAVVRVAGVARTPLQPRTLEWTDRPRYLLAAETFASGLHMRPVFVAALGAATTPAWPGEVLVLPRHVNVEEGAWLLTPDGQLVGMASSIGDGLAIVPASLVIAEAERALAAAAAPHEGLTGP